MLSQADSVGKGGAIDIGYTRIFSALIAYIYFGDALLKLKRVAICLMLVIKLNNTL
jgi:hypothetical protein